MRGIPYARALNGEAGDRASGQRHACGTDRVLQAGHRLQGSAERWNLGENSAGGGHGTDTKPAPESVVQKSFILWRARTDSNR